MDTRIVRGIRRSLLGAAAAALLGTTALTVPAAAGATGPAGSGTVISRAASPNGPVLVVGSGPKAQFALYFITSDQPPRYGCTTTPVTVAPGVTFACTGPETSQTDWPALTTTGRPVAGPGVRQALLGVVKRPDVGGDQVTYAGHPLYLFDPGPSQFTGSDLVESSTPPDHGIWYLVSPQRGQAAPQVATLTSMALQGGRTVLGAAMNAELNGPPSPVPFPVYTFSRDRRGRSACTGACATAFPPLLTSGRPHPAAGATLAGTLGTIPRADGTRQVTYDGRPLYLDASEAMTLTNTATSFTGTGDRVTMPGGGSFSLIALTGTGG